MSPLLSDHDVTPNVKLLRLVLGHIEMAPCTWDQEHWRRKAECGTVMCFAGWACTLAGGHWYAPSDGHLRSWLLAEDEDDRDLLFAFTRDAVIAARYRARRVLGLYEEQAHRLFSHDNTLEDLHRIVDEICSGATS